MASVAKRRWIYNGTPKEAWVVRYKDKGGAHRSRQFERKKEADLYCRQVENELEAGSHVARSTTVTIRQLWQEFMTNAEMRCRNGQVSTGYVKLVRICMTQIIPEIGNVILTELRWQDVEQMARRIREKTLKTTGRKISTDYFRTAIDMLSSIVDYGVRREYVFRNVVKDAKKEIGKLPRGVIKKFSRDEIKALVIAINEDRKGQNKRSQALLRCMVYLGAFCGMRRGEIWALTWEAIDFESGTIAVRASLTESDELKGPKTVAGVRTLPLPPAVAEALERWRPHASANERNLIFRSKTGKVIPSSWRNQLWGAYLAYAGMPAEAGGQRHFHALRHFAGSAWLEAGIPLSEVSRLMGHANPAITAQIYAHAIHDTQHRASILAACADGLVRPNPAPVQRLPTAIAA